jgi:IclR family acetate operon transcriptional repressor
MNTVVKSADRTLAILELLTEQSGGLTLAEIHTVLDLPKSSTFVLLMNMVDRGFLEQNAVTRRFQLGIRLWQAGQSYVAVTDLENAALAYMEALRDELNETVQLATLDGVDSVYIAKVDSFQQLRLAARVGTRLPAYATGLGKALLSQLDDADLQQRFADLEFVQYTPQTISSLPQLLAAVRNVRGAGYATENSEHTAGVFCVAAPIRLPAHSAPAAVSVSIPSVRKTPALIKTTVENVGATAEQISQRMGYHGAGQTPAG